VNHGYLVFGGIAVVAFVATVFITRVQTLNRLAIKIASLRKAAAEAHTYVPLGSEDSRSEEQKRRYDVESRELADNGFSSLGDVREQGSSGISAGVIRWFAGLDGRVCGWFAVMPTRQGPTTVRFLFSESATAEGFFITYSGPTKIKVTQPPTIQRGQIPVELGLAAAVARHQELTAASGGGLRTVGTLEEAIEVLRRLRVASQAWRAAQPYDSLLTSDLHLILGPRFDQLAEPMRRRLRKLECVA